ncbi:MAG: aminotransferase class I/II-fold pyridoxal phosphate-dependent enzyme [Ilumatobacter sp.]|uniref:threonine aldolase family protein n=1 Tax=Ilumatobacter sp. TaxID=1967498 RepID=UPI0026389994|nr:aminotransferase class I/II-fold pyridoxal phosphate-dependent enzyme [Ilumatobacter sp.]MDJ0768727.1 aminotransferase class I/II-fold pyridoxal phosphate-dependent enzyme [Ilumatobacter sp.]
MTLPEPPRCAFASDNAAGAHPAVLEAIARVNAGHALAYGDDEETRRCERAFDELFGRDVSTFLTFNGTGGNVMALTSLVRPGDAVVCTDWAHINVDETGAPERIAGCKLIDVACPDGKLTPDHVAEQATALGVPHHAQPAVVSITQSTELGTLYSIDEIGAICEVAHRHGMRVHMDGARIANATAALGGTVETLRAMTVDAGVDVVTFGATKNGALAAEAVVYLDRALASRAAYVRKTVTQLPSKMRFVAAQLTALLDGDRWIDLAAHANRLAGAMYERTATIDGVEHDGPPTVNSVFPTLPPRAIEPLRSWCFFWDWNPARHQVRWMTAWDTTEHDVERFAAGVTAILASHN